MPRVLRSGLTTGTCAAAAAAAAIEAYFGSVPKSVTVTLPAGEAVSVNVHSIDIKKPAKESDPPRLVTAAVQKDAGDDPDITNKAIIGAEVTVRHGECLVHIRGGEGVGKVTRPGLPVAVGEDAINPVPRRMIENEVIKRLKKLGAYTAYVSIFVRDGRKLAEKTLNPRLGIIGGISILGTTGIVKPFSAKSYRDTITTCLRSAEISGVGLCVFSTGRGSERKAMSELSSFPEASFILIADFFAFSVREAASMNFSSIVLSCFFGKLCKWAMRLEYTHAHTKETDFSMLADFALVDGMSREFCEFVRNANTAREIVESPWREKALFVDMVGRKALGWARCLAKKAEKIKIDIYCWDFNGGLLGKWS